MKSLFRRDIKKKSIFILILASIFISGCFSGKNIKDPLDKVGVLQGHTALKVFDAKNKPEDYLGWIFAQKRKDAIAKNNQMLLEKVWKGAVRSTGGMYKRILFKGKQVLELNARFDGFKMPKIFPGKDNAIDTKENKIKAAEEKIKKLERLKEKTEKDKKEYEKYIKRLEKLRKGEKDIEGEDDPDIAAEDNNSESTNTDDTHKEHSEVIDESKDESKGNKGMVSLDLAKFRQDFVFTVKFIGLEQHYMMAPKMMEKFRGKDSYKNEKYILSVVKAKKIVLEITDAYGVNVGINAATKGIQISAKYERSQLYNGFVLAKDAVVGYQAVTPTQRDLDRE